MARLAANAVGTQCVMLLDRTNVRLLAQAGMARSVLDLSAYALPLPDFVTMDDASTTILAKI